MDKQTLKKITIGVAIAIVLLLTYLVMLFDIGFWNATASPWGMISLYFKTGRTFPWLGIILLSAIALGLLYYIFKPAEDSERNFEYAESDVYGSAREMDFDELKDVADLGPIEDVGGTILGMLDDKGKECIAMPISATMNRNLIEFGIPGTGKTYAHVLGSIVQAVRRGESVVCTDTKGELWAKTSHYARSHGYIVRRFNLKDPKTSDGWAVLKELRLDDVRAMIFCKVVMANTGNEKDIHIALEETLLKACCLYVERNDAIPPEEKTFYAVCKMISEGADALDTAFANCATNPALNIAAKPYMTFKNASPNLKGNTISNLTARLQALDSPAIQLLTSKDDIDLTLPGRKKCIYYCILSDQHDTMRFLGSLFFSYLFQDLAEYADRCPGSHLPIPITIILEEAYAVGSLYGMTNALSTARSRGIGITMILQGYGQLKELYGEDAATTILNDCAIHACIGTNDQMTAELMAWETGETTTKVQSVQHSKDESIILPPFRRNYSEGFGKRFVYNSSEIRQIKPGHILICWQGHNCIMAKTVGIHLHPECQRKLMPQTDTYTSVTLDDDVAREYMRQQEEKYISEYEQWIADGGDDWEGYGYRSQPLARRKAGGEKESRPSVTEYQILEKTALMRSSAVRASKKADVDDDFDDWDELIDAEDIELDEEEEQSQADQEGSEEYEEDFSFVDSVSDETPSEHDSSLRRAEDEKQSRDPVGIANEDVLTVPQQEAAKPQKDTAQPTRPQAVSSQNQSHDEPKQRQPSDPNVPKKNLKSQKRSMPSYDGKKQTYSARGSRKGGFDVTKMDRN